MNKGTNGRPAVRNIMWAPALPSTTCNLFLSVANIGDFRSVQRARLLKKRVSNSGYQSLLSTCESQAPSVKLHTGVPLATVNLKGSGSPPPVIPNGNVVYRSEDFSRKDILITFAHHEDKSLFSCRWSHEPEDLVWHPIQHLQGTWTSW